MKLRWPTPGEWRIGVPGAVPLLVVGVFMVRGCATPDGPNLHPPADFALQPEPTIVAGADLTGVQLPGVDGTTIPDAIRATGTAHLFGTVNGPQGPLPGATVRVEHLVADDPPPVDVVADAAGHWDLPNIAGGRYRVRGFQVPSFAQVKPEIFFLDDGTERSVDLGVDSFTGVSAAGAIAPDPPEFHQPFDLTVRVAVRSVGPDGAVHAQPVFGAQVALTNTPGFNVKSPGSATTDTNGDASFTLECSSEGAAQLDV